MNLIVWPLTLICALLPFTTETYYSVEPLFSGVTFCTFDLNNKYFYFWLSAIFVGPLQLTIVTLVGLSLFLYCRIKTSFNKKMHMNLVSSVVAYPLIMLGAWTPLVFVFFHDFMDKPDVQDNTFEGGYTRLQVAYAWTAFEGALIAIAFYYNSGEARTRWKRWFKQKYGKAGLRHNEQDFGVGGDGDGDGDDSSVRQSTATLIDELKEDYANDIDLEKQLEDENVAYIDNMNEKIRMSRMSELTVQSQGTAVAQGDKEGRISGTNPSISGRGPSLPALDSQDNIA